jgi:hypothetical protein
MRPLASALAVHERHGSRPAIPAVFGDGYLLAHNALYRNVRELVLRAGFRFSDSPPFPYFELKLLSLEDVMTSRCIPYVDNVSAARRAERLAPGRLSLEDLAQVGLEINTLLHESVHGIVRRRLALTPPDDDVESLLTAQQRRILDRLFEESCANAVECVYTSTAVDDVERLFVKLNSYQPPWSANEALEALGVGGTLRLLIVAYLISNFLFKKLPERVVWDVFGEFLDARTLKMLGRKGATALFKHAAGLNPRFRLVTTSIYLKFVGIDGAITDALDFEFLEEFGEGRRLRQVLDDVVDLFTRGTSAPAAASLSRRSRSLRGGSPRPSWRRERRASSGVPARPGRAVRGRSRR